MFISNFYFTFNVGNESNEGKTVKIEENALNITEAQSHVYGFNIKSTAKDNIPKEIQENALTIPAQWCEYHQFTQGPQTSSIFCNAVISLWEVGQLVFTFPNSVNQLTVSRNPFLNTNLFYF